MVFLGIDVSKDRLDCALLAEGGGKPLGGRSFPNDAAGLDRVAAWAARTSGVAEADVHVVLEATAAYHELAAHRLAAAGMRVSIVNSARVRSFAKGLGILGKTDPIDARLLARYGQLLRPRAWQPPARALLELEALLARLDDVEADLRREENRLEQVRVRGCPRSWSAPCSRASRRPRAGAKNSNAPSPRTSRPPQGCKPTWTGCSRSRR